MLDAKGVSYFCGSQAQSTWLGWYVTFWRVPFQTWHLDMLLNPKSNGQCEVFFTILVTLVNYILRRGDSLEEGKYKEKLI